MSNKFVIGDKVRVVKYGHAGWQSKDHYPKAKQWGDTLAGKIWFSDKHFIAPLDKNAKPPNILSEDKYGYTTDSSPELVGKIGIIADVSDGEYAINGIPGKYAWYNEEQLEMVNPNPNR